MRRRKQRLNKATLFRDRVDKARSTLPFIKVNNFQSAKPKDLFVPGSNSKTYNVIIKRDNGNRKLFTECFLQIDNFGHAGKCKGSLNSVCYHAIGAIIYSAEKSDYKVAICDTERSAISRANIDGKIFEIVSIGVPDNPVWIVLTSNVEKSADQNIKELGY